MEEKRILLKGTRKALGLLAFEEYQRHKETAERIFAQRVALIGDESELEEGAVPTAISVNNDGEVFLIYLAPVPPSEEETE